MTPQHLRASRLALRLSHAQFAAALGVDVADVANWESGDAAIDPFLLALAAAWVELCVEAAAASRTRANQVRAPLHRSEPAMAAPC